MERTLDTLYLAWPVAVTILWEQSLTVAEYKDPGRERGASISIRMARPGTELLTNVTMSRLDPRLDTSNETCNSSLEQHGGCPCHRCPHDHEYPFSWPLCILAATL